MTIQAVEPNKSVHTEEQNASVQATDIKATDGQAITMETVQSWLIAYLSQLLELEVKSININHSFESYGLDSSTSIGLTADLEDWLGIGLDPTLLYEYPNIQELAEYLVHDN